MSRPGDLADAAQLKRAPILLHPALGAVFGVHREPEADLSLLFGRGRLRQRRNRQFFGLAVAAGAVEPPHRFCNQQPVLSVIGGKMNDYGIA